MGFEEEFFHGVFGIIPLKELKKFFRKEMI
jgi:hypothetical protein